MPIDTIQFANAPNEDGLTVTMRGDPAQIVRVLVNGLPREAIQQLHQALQVELQHRAAAPEPRPRGEPACTCGTENPSSARHGHSHLAWCAVRTATPEAKP